MKSQSSPMIRIVEALIVSLTLLQGFFPSTLVGQSLNGDRAGVSIATQVQGITGSEPTRLPNGFVSSDTNIFRSFYGSCLNADDITNTWIGGPTKDITDIRFRAPRTGSLSGVRVYLMWGSTPGVYSGGNGGSILVELHPDDSTSQHLPSTKILSSLLYANPMSGPFFPVLTFSTPAGVQQGAFYHLVFSNPTASSSSDYVSINSLYMQHGLRPRQQTLTDENWLQLLSSSSTPGVWKPRDNRYNHGETLTPIVEIKYSDGYSGGIGYVEVWSKNPKVISGQSSVRESFTYSGNPFRVARVCVRAKRSFGSDPLVLTLESSDGSAPQQVSVASTKIDTTHVWINFDFARVFTLTANTHYNLALTTSPVSHYEAFPIVKGSASSVGFSSSTYFADGYAQFTTGGTWTGWDNGGQLNHTEADLQFFFTKAADSPNPPVIISPAFGTRSDSLQQLVRWIGVPDAISYELQMAEDTLFASPVSDTITQDTVSRTDPLQRAKTYYLRVRAQTLNGLGPFSRTSSFSTSSKTVSSSSGSQLPSEFKLEQNYPNPFNSSTVFEFALPRPAFTSLRIFDLLGAQVATIVYDYLSAGRYRYQWDAVNVASGYYIGCFRAGAYSRNLRVLLLR